MKCPYCAEEVKDEAITCRFCGRDLAFFRPVHEKLKSLEHQISQLTSSVSGVANALAATGSSSDVRQRAADTFQASRYLLPPVFAIVTSIFFFCAYYRYFDQKFPELLWLSLLAPLPFGLWRGITWKGVHWKHHVVMGAIIGAVSVIGTAVVYGGIAPDAIPITAWYLCSATLCFTAGGVSGDWIEAVLTNKQASRAVHDIARRFVGERPAESSDSSSAAYDRRLKFAESSISAISPLLTFIAAIVSAYFTYKSKVGS